MKNWKIVKRICTNGEFRAAVLNEKGKFVIATEQYLKKLGLATGLASIKKNGIYQDAYETKLSKNGKYYFNMKSLGNHKVIAGPSRLFDTRAEMMTVISTMISEIQECDEVTKMGFWSASFEDKYGEVPDTDINL